MVNENIKMVLMVVCVIIGVLGLTIGMFPLLKKKGYPVEKTLDTAEDVIDKAGSALDVAGEILPANPTINILKIIQSWAKTAVGNAEQLYHAGDIGKDDRATIAEQVVLNVLKELNITIDDNKKTLIDAAIKEAVNNLGHAPVDEKAQAAAQEELQKINETLLSENITLKEQSTQLNSENSQLKQTISAVQSTVQAAQPASDCCDTAAVTQ